ncbi:hypothetical protein [Bradyrhizobium sp. 23]|uniref:hypothetical protein n=1 Tax=Bradyrhizobium sp. 23 TaxID=2782667 RepID=UPI001FF96C6F|nr:hypothetical protein [Bradyrhizobium sp. 23]MCK1312897.1 hypothetical protein [Bradyrhizobium sp. 23]
MLHVDPGSVVGLFRRLIGADARVAPSRDRAGHMMIVVRADDPAWLFVAAAGAHCGRVGSVNKPISFSAISLATKYRAALF